MSYKVLIVGTVPYNKKSTSRAFEAYFSGWERENLAQIFSNTKAPVKGHCGTLFQITDQRILKRLYNRRQKTGRIFNYDELADEWLNDDLETGSRLYSELYKMGSKKSPLKYLLRKLLWRKKFWNTPELNEWLEKFSPDCVFLAFSDDCFIPEIALYVAEKFDIPIVSCIGDDYYFNDRKTLSPIYHIYRKNYKKLIRRVFSHGGSAIYISDRIRDLYNGEFGLNGQTVYLSSEIQRKGFKPIDKDKPKICYFGNIRQGRNESLNEIGFALGEISHDYVLEVYSNQNDESAISIFRNNPNVRFCSSIPYKEVVEKTAQSDIVVIVEGFKPHHINVTRYSLSTKAADSLASGAAILTYGSEECGVIEYMASTQAAMVCTKKSELAKCIKTLIEDESLQRHYYENAVEITLAHHNLGKSVERACTVIESAIIDYEYKKRIFNNNKQL